MLAIEEAISPSVRVVIIGSVNSFVITMIQLATKNGRLLTKDYQPTTINQQLSTDGCQWTAINGRLSKRVVLSPNDTISYLWV